MKGKEGQGLDPKPVKNLKMGSWGLSAQRAQKGPKQGRRRVHQKTLQTCQFLIRDKLNRERKLKHTVFFLKLFGHLQHIPAKSRDIRPRTFDFPGFEGDTELFGPTPSRGRPPPHPKISGPKSLGLGSFFLPDEYSKSFRGSLSSAERI